MHNVDLKSLNIYISFFFLTKYMSEKDDNESKSKQTHKKDLAPKGIQECHVYFIEIDLYSCTVAVIACSTGSLSKLDAP